MLAKERQNKIRQMLEQDGAVTTSRLVELFEVSVETIRRDFLTMERGGFLNRVHGGAVAAGKMQPFYDLEKRNEDHNEQKVELASYACRFIQEGDHIALDTGSTAICLAHALRERFTRLTVVTNSVDVFEILKSCQGFSIFLCGGYYMKEENAFCGSLVLEALSKLHVQKAFLFPSAVSLEFGIGDFQQDIYLVQKKIMEMSDQIYILADSSKFEKRALLKVDDMNPEYQYVTDSRLSAELKSIYLENQMKIYNGGNDK